ncbi:DUF2771 family protein [Klenkia sp. PcliD-1-E]|uniref:DUF2771 family protein n=1 Tax=Klenkia sp. PcliD-1-E TaxID=2954492 RepID=UPI0020972C28|nr:DUF2771 family protein [Klenkia sp. PcliD-1-E]MCO7222218.1 DUF2771 domain-containing protein [Klenkia sp. PcliD-1-E]
MTRVATTAACGAAVLVLVTGCGAGGSSGAADQGGPPPTVRVQSSGQDVTVQPSQYCLDGTGERYAGTPPVIEVQPDSTISLTVPDAVAAQGWSVQVYDDQLQELLGEVDVPGDTPTFTGINSSDAVPPAYYLVVVEDSRDGACSGLSGAWPVGFIRSGDQAPTG